MPNLKTILQSKIFLILSLIFIICYAFITTKIIKYDSIYNINSNEIKGIIIDKSIDGDKLSLTIKSQEKLKGTYYFKSEAEKNKIANSLKYGSKVTINGTLTKPSKNTIPNTFNYQNYLYNNHIYYTMNIEKITIDNSNISPLYKIKNAFINRINKFNNAKSYIYTFILGDKDYISDDVYEAYQNNGVTHLFAVSGMHVSFLVLMWELLFKKLKVKETIGHIIIILFLSIYMFLIGFTASVIRASLLYIFLLLNKKFKYNLSSLKILYYLFFLLTIINPFYLYNLGFLYSFLTTFGLMLFSKKITGNYLTKTFKVSFIAFIFSLPITIYNFYEFNLFTIINNIIMVPLVSIILFPLTIITFLIPFLEPILNICINILEFINNLLNSFSLNIVIAKVNIIFILIYYFIIYLIYKYNFKKTFYLVILIIASKLFPHFDNNNYIYYLDVGQGDSSLIITKHQKDVIMIDTGGKITYPKEDWQKREHEYSLMDNIVTFLKSKGLNKLDLLIITHGDADHMKEAYYLVDDLINQIKVNKLMLNNNSLNNYETNLKNEIKQIISNNYQGKELTITNLNEYVGTDENDSSLVLYTNLSNYNILFMGDAPKMVEQNIMNKYNLKINILKLGHHGSKTSSDYDFLKMLNPNYSIISAGRNNRYNHPSPETITNLNNLNLKYYSTISKGTIEFILSKKDVKIQFYPP